MTTEAATLPPFYAQEIEAVATITAAYFANNLVPIDKIGDVVASIHGAIRAGSVTDTPKPAELKPAVPVNKSVTPDFIICLEDGQKFKSLRRHLRVHFNMTPEQYREKWGLPSSYPMVAPNYSAIRSQLAKDNGLGTK